MLLKADMLHSWSSPCSWDTMAVKLYVYPREETACQHEFKTNSKIIDLSGFLESMEIAKREFKCQYKL